MKINVHAGHNYHVPGASGKFSETSEDRKVKNEVIKQLKAAGHTVYDCTDEDGTTQNANLKNIVTKCNAHSVDLDVSIHFNAYNGTAHGTEVWVYKNSTLTSTATAICKKIAALGFTNRGVKETTSLYVLKNTKASALLVECCFCDSATDANLYNYKSMATAIVQGITGTSSSSESGSTTLWKGVTTQKVNVREKASKDSDIIATMKAGANISVVAETTNWVQRKHGGWVAKKYVTKV